MTDEADDNVAAGDWSSPHGWRTAGRDPDWLDAVCDDDCEFWLGVHQPNWSWAPGYLRGPAFISATRLRARATPFPRALVPIAIDSGGFTQVTQHGRWLISPQEYVGLVQRATRELGTVRWAAIQDWMCEDVALKATGLSVAEHQQRSVDSYRTLLDLDDDVRWLPVLQGREVDDYLRCWDLYDRAGVDLLAHQLVGLGSVCRRQATHEIVSLVHALAGRGLRLHGFGVKATGLRTVGDLLRSADSLAWSLNGRSPSRQFAAQAERLGKHVNDLTAEEKDDAIRNQPLRDSQGRRLANSPEHATAARDEMLTLIRERGAYLWAPPTMTQAILGLPYSPPSDGLAGEAC